MSKNEDGPTPCHSESSRTAFHHIRLISILCTLTTPAYAGLVLAADLAFQESASRSVEITERFVGFPDVDFDLDSMKLDEEAERDLQPVIDYLKTHPDGRVRLEGHVDDHYSNAYGLVLSERRADLVKIYLRQYGISNPIQTSGYGNDRPFCFERSEKCRRKNNRVHILVIEVSRIPKPVPMAMSHESHGSAPRAAEAAPVQTSQPAQANSQMPSVFDYPTVYFQRNSFQIDKKARASLRPLAKHLKSHPDLQIRLIGRVDERHTSAYGFSLSDKRAEAVKNFLREHGVKNAIKTQGVGKDKPICFEHNEACFRISNQVDVVRYEVVVHE